MTPPPPQTPQYLTILRAERGPYYVCRILAPPMPPLQRRHNNYSYLNGREREGGPLFFVGCWRPQCPPPQTPQYLTILRTERGCHYVCRILAQPMPPPSHDATILIYLNDRKRGAIIFCRILAPPQCPPTLPRGHNTYLS